MSPSDKEQQVCVDCGKIIVEKPIVLSATESLCGDCWPFLLKPIPREQLQPMQERKEPQARKSA